MISKAARAALAIALFVAACGGGDAATSTSGAPSTTAADTTTTSSVTTVTPGEAGFPVTIETAAGPVTIAERPQRIVSLSATATEMLFAIGAGEQVVAADDTSDYPADAPATDLNGFTVTAEGVAAFEPDLVVYFFDPGDLAAGLEALGIPAIFHGAPATIDDVATQIEQMGAATGHLADAAAVVAQMSADLSGIAASVAEAGVPEATYYYELDQSYYSLTSATFVGTLLAELGLTSVADVADEAGTGYPQLSAELILEADPDLILLADTVCCAQSAATVAARPGWDTLTAVTAGAIVELDDAVASRWGPRVVDLVREVADALVSLQGADA